MLHEAKKYLYDIRQSCELILRFIKGKQFADYVEDPLLRSAVERQLEIIGEAANTMSKATSEVAARITHHGRMIAMRNRLIHGYSMVDNTVVWDVVQYDLPALMKQTEDLLAEE
jgi:uncharacterized protein with HEPN domain